MKRFFNNKSGFTLTEMLIAGGLAGLVALVAYTTLRSSQSVVGTSLVTAEVSFMKNQLIANLGIPENCERNFAGRLVQSPASPPAYITSLVKRTRTTVAGQDTFNWQPFIEVNKYYGEGTNKTMLIQAIDTAPSPTNPNSLIITVSYDIRSTLKKAGGNPNPKFTVEVFIVKDNAGTTVRSCATDVFTMIKNAIAFSCKGNGATYNAAAGLYGTCTHNNIRVQNEAGATIVGPAGLCPAGEFLAKEVTTIGTTSGATTTAGTTTYSCKKYTTRSDLTPFGTTCPPNTFMKSVKPNGDAECVSMQSFYGSIPVGYVITPTAGGTFQAIKFTCDNANEVMIKMNASGIPTCVPKQIVGSCPANQYIVGINTNGSPKCQAYPRINGPCPAGQYIKSVGSDGAITACEAPTLPASTACNGGDYVINYLYGDGSAYCLLNN